MKKSLLVLVLFIGMMSSYNTTEAQNVSVSINIGLQPTWGPVGYDYVDYYYFPDINCYFNVNFGLFYYFDHFYNRWFSARYLPFGYRDYDLHGLYKVVLVGVHDPWRFNNHHIRDYRRYIGYTQQVVIRDSRDMRYRNNRNNNIAWYSGNQYDNGRTNSNFSSRSSRDIPSARSNNAAPSARNSREATPQTRSSNATPSTRSSREATPQTRSSNAAPQARSSREATPQTRSSNATPSTRSGKSESSVTRSESPGARSGSSSVNQGSSRSSSNNNTSSRSSNSSSNNNGRSRR